jgi:hypothetical protein
MNHGPDSNEPKKVDPLEVFQVLGASDETKPETLEETAREVGASPEVVEFMERLPQSVSEPADVVAAAAEPENNEAGVELELPDETETLPSLSIDDVTGGKREAPSKGWEPPR